MKKLLAILFGLAGGVGLGIVLVQTFVAGDWMTFIFGLSILAFLVAGLLAEWE